MPLEKAKLKSLADQIDALQQEARALESKFEAAIEKVDPAYQPSARNLLHYLALRHNDIRGLQVALAEMGFSSLGRTESHVLASLQAVRRQLAFLLRTQAPKNEPVITFAESEILLKTHTDTLLGKAPNKRSSRIMVTFSTDLATDYELVCRLMKTGMNCARINCAHDNPAVWKKMIANVKKAEKELDLECKILMDLMGPKLRTGPLKPGPQLVAIHPERNEQGQIMAPARVWLAPQEVEPPLPVDARLPVTAGFINSLQKSDQITFLDTRGRKRRMTVADKMAGGALVHLFKTSYLANGTTLKLKSKGAFIHATEVGELPALQVPILLRADQYLVLHKDPVPGEPAQYNEKGHVIKPAHISCTLPEIFEKVKPGQPILFDDGEIEGEIQEATAESLVIKILATKDKGSRLIADKGINLPDSKLNIIDLTEKDKEDLAFVAKHADIVNLSFVNHPDTVVALQQELKKHKAEDMGIMLKIETKEGFRNLPHLLLAVMRSPTAGIMIARGDLAVECGWQRLAEVQEEILWLCEAAHMPVVWATQVLETLAKKGRPSRAEITDAAMSQRADCVMLNKGPHVIQAIRLLDNILQTMQEHQHKKTSMLRSLHVSELEHLYEEPAGEK